MMRLISHFTLKNAKIVTHGINLGQVLNLFQCLTTGKIPKHQVGGIKSRFHAAQRVLQPVRNDIMTDFQNIWCKLQYKSLNDLIEKL